MEPLPWGGRTDCQPLRSFGQAGASKVMPLTLRLDASGLPQGLAPFRASLERNPEVTRIITQHLSERNTWVLATSLQHYTQLDKEDIINDAVAMYPQRQHLTIQYPRLLRHQVKQRYDDQI